MARISSVKTEHSTQPAALRVAAFAMGLLAVWPAAPAWLHPLGNFTISHYSALVLSPGRLRVDYGLDFAEIPTFQSMEDLDDNHDGQVSDAEKRAFLDSSIRGWLANLSLRVDGRDVAPTVRTSSLELLPGAGGLNTMKVWLGLEAELPRDGAAHRIRYEDDNYPARPGWKELVATASGVKLGAISIPAQDRSARLTSYPTGTLEDTPQVTQAEFEFTAAAPVAAGARTGQAAGAQASAAAGSASGTADSREVTGGVDKLAANSSRRMGSAIITGGQTVARSQARAGVQPPTSSAPAPAHARATCEDAFTRLIGEGKLTPGFIALAVLAAFGLGALHAMSPGHGKTLVGAYLVGSRGTPSQAVFLGLVVTAAHTIGVFGLGLVTLWASKYFLPDRIFPWLGFGSGLMVALIGAALFHDRIELLLGRTEEHRHLFWRHRAGSDPDEGHLPTDRTGRVTARSLLALGISGGIVPCPSALVVMLASIALHRIQFGLLLIVGFSLGLAATLTGIGLVFVYAGQWLSKFRSGNIWMRLLPVGSAAVVTAVGMAIAFQALSSAGLIHIRL